MYTQILRKKFPENFLDFSGEIRIFLRCEFKINLITVWASFFFLISKIIRCLKNTEKSEELS